MAQCPRCGAHITPQPDKTNVAGMRVAWALEMALQEPLLTAQQVNAELMDTINELWEENRELKRQLADRPAPEV